MAGRIAFSRKLASGLAVAGLAGGLLAGTPAAPALAGHRAAVPRIPQVKAATGLRILRPRRVPRYHVALYRPTAVSWPAAARAEVRLGATSAASVPRRHTPGTAGATATTRYAAGTPVWLRPVSAAGDRVTGARVRVLGHSAALALGVRGVVFTAAPLLGSDAGTVRLGLSYARFAQAYGGNYGLGLGLVELPACALTTPRRAGCERQRRLAAVNNPLAEDVSAQVSLGQGGVVLAAAPELTDGGGPAGTYTATALRASGSWAEGGSSGSFTYSYPMSVPPAATGLTPDLGLDYDSGTVDGQTAATQAQASWVGDGWSSPASFIEQSFIPCDDAGGDAPSSSQDACYNGPILTLSQDGTSTPLVCSTPFSYSKTSTCTLADDNGEVVTYHVTSDNGTGIKFYAYWTITTRDGSTSYFGLNHLPGWKSGDPATDSVDTEPVFSYDSAGPCYKSGDFTGSVCPMAYRWNMDYVTNVHGGAMAYYYDQAPNAYDEYGSSAAVSYTRDSYLDHIDYGFTDGNAYSGHAPDQVTFTTGDRCFAASCDPISSNEENWYDVPYGQYYCATGDTSCSTAGPTFWSTVRLARVTTQQWNGSTYVPADSWKLMQEFPDTGDGTSPSLFLKEITHTGADTTAGGSAVPLPTVTFKPQEFANRLNWDNYVPLVRPRIVDITTETGAQIAITYEQPNQCVATKSQLPTPSSNNQSCFPVYWQQFTKTPDWFIKYAVESVTESDPTGGSGGLSTSYLYGNGSAAWHYDDNELVLAKYRTYGQWRGYQQVTTNTGDSDDALTQATASYYQGMSDDNNSTTVTLTDSQGGSHDDTDQLAGDVLESTVYNFSGGPVDHSTIYSYWVSAPVASRSRSGLPALTANVTGLVETWARQAITDSSTTTWRKTETDVSYDNQPSDADFGLPLFTYDHGDLSDPSQQTCTSTTYTAPDTKENLTGLVAETETDAAACGGANPDGASAPTASQINALTAPTSLSRPADVISDTRTYYDDPPVLSGGVAVPSNPAWPQAAPSTGDASVVQQATGYTSGAFTYMTKAATVYDSYGRPVTSYDANGNQTTTSYTTTNGVTTAQQVTNPLGQTTATTFDPLRGLPLTTTDANGITTTFAYDGLGRLISVWADGRPATDKIPTVAYSYDVSQTAPTVVTTQTLNDQGGQIASTTLYDALLRVRQTQSLTPAGGVLVSDNFYDTRGWLYQTNTNTYVSGSDPGDGIISVPDSDATDRHVTDFDGLGRPVRVTDNDELATRSTTYYAYYGDRVTTVPPTGGTPTSTVTDALGRTTELDQYTSPPTVATSTANKITTVTISGGTTQATDYGYNTRGELGTITDASTGEQWTKTYNLLGQITATTDPNGGTSTMAYDNNGNLTSATDADGHTISYSYDALNRKTGEYDGPNSSSPPIASWDYDNSNNAVPDMTDPIGQLTTETSYSGGNAYTIQQTGFNNFGESLGQTVTLPKAEGALAGSYTLSHTYTPLTGLPASDSYPASPGAGALPAEKVTYGYDVLDLPNTLQSTLAAYVQDIIYAPDFQVSQEEIGSTTDNATITNIYDSNTGNLTDTSVENSAVSSTPFDDTSYSYDAAGNTTSETDTRNGTASETQCYSYDTLDRLTQAWTGTDDCAADPSSNGGATVGDGIPGSAYWTSWAFNSLGQRTSETGHNLTGGANTVTSYTYNGNSASQPNTLTSTATTGPSGTSTASYSYDADGNTLTRDLPSGNHKLTWTGDGKLATDTTSAGTTSYIYDADGNILLQKDPAQTTVYLFGGAQQIALASGAITGTRFIPLPGGGEVVRTGSGSNYDYELTNQQDTGTLTLNSTCQDPQWRQYTPYGAPRGTPPASWPDTNGFLGKPTSQDTGLTLLGARAYDPTTGQFLSLDPLLDPTSPGQLNGYTYANDNPVTLTDPTGAYVSGGSGSGCTAGDPNARNCHINGSQGDGGCSRYALGCYGDNYSGGTGTDPYPGQYLLPEPDRAAYIEYATLHPVEYASALPPAATELDSINLFCQNNGGDCPTSLTNGAAHDWIFIASATMGGGLLAAGTLGRGEDTANLGPGISIDSQEEPAALQDLSQLGCSFGQSFTPTTKILLANGKTAPIATLKPGDKILATNTTTGHTQPEAVAAVLVHHDTDLYDLTIRTGPHDTIIHTTTSHLFWVPSLNKFLPVSNLKPGTHLKTPDGQAAIVVGSSTPALHEGWMWDLTVPGNDDHDFYVAVAATAVLVHNCLEGEEVANNIADHANERAQAGDGTHYVSGVEPQDLPGYVHQVLDGEVPGVETRYLSNGRIAYWDPATQAVIIEDGGGGTVFTPAEGYDYFEGLG